MLLPPPPRVELPTCLNRSYGLDRLGVPDSRMARRLRRTAAMQASVWGESALRALVVRRLWLSSTITTPKGSAAMQCAAEGLRERGVGWATRQRGMRCLCKMVVHPPRDTPYYYYYYFYYWFPDNRTTL